MILAIPYKYLKTQRNTTYNIHNKQSNSKKHKMLLNEITVRKREKRANINSMST